MSVSSGVARSRSLRWENSVNSSVGGSYIRVASLTECFACSSARASYHIRAYETTYSLPRFNNSGTQTTLLIAPSSNRSVDNVCVRNEQLAGSPGTDAGSFGA